MIVVKLAIILSIAYINITQKCSFCDKEIAPFAKQWMNCEKPHILDSNDQFHLPHQADYCQTC